MHHQFQPYKPMGGHRTHAFKVQFTIYATADRPPRQHHREHIEWSQPVSLSRPSGQLNVLISRAGAVRTLPFGLRTQRTHAALQALRVVPCMHAWAQRGRQDGAR